MRKLVPPALAGLLFGAGLVVSDMVNPARVLAFLDVAGNWDPALAFVMVGAVAISALTFGIRRRMARPVLAQAFKVPTTTRIDRRLLAGATLFGVGWGLAGLCPGPAIAGLAFGVWQFWLFVAAMFAGMVAHRLTVDRWLAVSKDS